MLVNFLKHERRRFGRRSMNVAATAELPGAIEVQCTIDNISDGGALLSFPQGLAPIRTFRLVVEGFEIRLRCEIRHHEEDRLGVRFEKLAEGMALNHFLRRDPAQPVGIEARTAPALVRPRLSAWSVRTLREALLVTMCISGEFDFDVEASYACDDEYAGEHHHIFTGDAGEAVLATAVDRPRRPARIVRRSHAEASRSMASDRDCLKFWLFRNSCG